MQNIHDLNSIARKQILGLNTERKDLNRISSKGETQKDTRQVNIASKMPNN